MEKFQKIREHPGKQNMIWNTEEKKDKRLSAITFFLYISEKIIGKFFMEDRISCGSIITRERIERDKIKIVNFHLLVNSITLRISAAKNI